MKLTPAEAADLYAKGQSACEIARDYGLTRQGAEARIRAGGLGGNVWCPIHRTHEHLRLENAEALGRLPNVWGKVPDPELGRPAAQQGSLW
jgi:hypothetical protein